jgi:hypothetical protein
MSRRAAALLVFVASSFVVPGCSPDYEGDPVRTNVDPKCSGENARPAIVGGYADSSCDETTAVVRVNIGPQDGHGPGLCTGTLVAPNVVLTAGHCVAAASSDAQRCTEIPPVWLMETKKSLSVTVERGEPGDKDHARIDLDVKEVKRPDDDALCGADVALLVLPEPVSSAVARPLRMRLSEPVRVGQTVNVIGYGKRETGYLGRRDRVGPIPVVRVGPSASACGRPTLRPHEFETGRAFCQGDSGGPAIDAETGEIVGVVARNEECTSDVGFVYSEIAGHRTFIEGVLTAAAPGLAARETPEVPMPRALGNVCKKSAECDTGYCVVDPGRSYCSRPCDAEHPCPATWTCAVTGHARVCVPESAPTAFDRELLSPPPEDRTPLESEGGGCSRARPEAPECPSEAAVVAAAVLGLRRRRRTGSAQTGG